MKIAFLQTNGVYSHKLVSDGIIEALNQIKKEDNTFDFIEHNICKQDDGTIVAYKPDWVFVSAPLAAGFRTWQKYRNQKCVIYDTEGLYEPALMRDSMRYATIAMTVDKRGCQYFNEWAVQNNVKCKVYHLPLGFSPNIYHFQTVEEKYKSDILIAGVMFNRRRDVLEMLEPIKNLYKIKVICPKDWLGKIIHKNGIEILDTQSPEEMGKYMSGAKINLCVNRDYEPSNDTKIESTTPGRVFQETACRRMVMIDNTRPEVFDYFKDNEQIVSYRIDDNGEELRNKITYYLEHEHEREAIAHNGHERTMKENQWYHRIKKVLDILNI
jgi:spore maturation protein CgeB